MKWVKTRRHISLISGGSISSYLISSSEAVLASVFKFAHIWLEYGTPRCKIKENPSRSAGCWHNQHLCFLALPLLTCMPLSKKNLMVSFPKTHYCWVLYFVTAHIMVTQNSRSGSSYCKSKENPPGSGPGHCWQNQHFCFLARTFSIKCLSISGETHLILPS